MIASIAAQISRLERAVDDLCGCVASLEGHLFLTKLNGWSPRDIVAHLIGWNRYVIRGSEQIKRGKLPFYDVDPGENYSKVNAEIVAECDSTDREELLGQLKETAAELKEYLRTVDPAEWERDYGVRHGDSVVIIRDTIDELIDDYGHHRRQIDRWV